MLAFGIKAWILKMAYSVALPTSVAMVCRTVLE